MAADIEAWLASGQDYAAGVALYQVHGRSAVYKGLFTAGATGYSRGLLVRELQALVATSDIERTSCPPDVRSVSEPAPPASAPAPVVVVDEQHPALQQVRAQLKQARDERSQLHAQLTAPRLRVADRCTMVHRICDLTDQVYELQEAEAHVLEHGRLPGPVALADVTDPAELQRRRNNLRSQRSRLQHNPDRAADLAQVVADLALIEHKLTS